MKKLVIWLTVIAVLCFVIAGTILVVNGFEGLLTFQTKGSETVNTEKTFDASGVKDINVNVVSTDVKIIPSDSEKIKVHFFGTTTRNAKGPAEELVAERKGDSLDIKVKHKVKFTIGISLNHQRLKLEVYVPKNYAGNLKVDSVSADLDVQESKWKVLDFQSVSGDMRANAVKTELANIDTISGDAKVEGFAGDLKFKSVSGDINAEFDKYNNDIIINTTSGDARIKLPEESEFNARFVSVSGDFNSVFPLTVEGFGKKHNFQGYLGNSENEINANTVSGDLEVIK